MEGSCGGTLDAEYSRRCKTGNKEKLRAAQGWRSGGERAEPGGCLGQWRGSIHATVVNACHVQAVGPAGPHQNHGLWDNGVHVDSSRGREVVADRGCV